MQDNLEISWYSDRRRAHIGMLQFLSMETLQNLESQTDLGLLSALEVGTNVFPGQNCDEPKWLSPSPELQALWQWRHLEAHTCLCRTGLSPSSEASSPHPGVPSPPVLRALSCRGCSCSAWKQNLWATPVPSPPSHPLRLSKSKQMNLLRPELCLGTQEPAVPFQNMPLPAGVGSLGSELRGAAWMRPGREGRRLLLERKAVSSGVGNSRAALSRLAWEVLTWSSVLGLRVSSCCAAILLYRKNRLFLNQIWVGMFIKASHGCLGVSSCLAQRYRHGNLSRKHLLDVLLASGTPQCMAGLVCKYTSNVSENRELLQAQKTDGTDPESQFTAPTFPMTIAAQLQVAFPWAALKIPQGRGLHKLSRPALPEFYSSCFGGSIRITFLIPHG